MERQKAETVTYKEFIERAGNVEGYMAASLTDEFIVDYWPGKRDLQDREEKILEIRIFNDKEEFKLVRTDISQEFKMRHIQDENLKKSRYMDELQYLDINTKRTLPGTGIVYTTGGGQYCLPKIEEVENGDIGELKVKIRYYFGRYKNSGQARIIDWRIVGFENGKEKK